MQSIPVGVEHIYGRAGGEHVHQSSDHSKAFRLSHFVLHIFLLFSDVTRVMYCTFHIETMHNLFLCYYILSMGESGSFGCKFTPIEKYFCWGILNKLCYPDGLLILF